MSRRFDLIVFDWDGTLIDSAAAIVASIQGACRDLDFPIPDERRAAHVIGLGLQDALAHACPEMTAADYPRMVDAYRRHWLARDALVSLFDGAADLLEELEGRGHALAIATGKSAAGLARQLEKTQLARRFAATRCADQCTSKPAPDMLLELMEEIGVAPDRTLMIGDTTHDLGMAENAGVTALAVGYGAHPAEALAEMRPEALLHSIAELRTWLHRNA